MTSREFSIIVVRLAAIYVAIRGLIGVAAVPILYGILAKSAKNHPLWQELDVFNAPGEFQGSVLGLSFTAQNAKSLLWTQGLVGAGVFVLGIVLLLFSSRLGAFIARGLR